MQRIDDLGLAMALLDGITPSQSNFAPVGYAVTSVGEEIVITRGIMREYGHGTDTLPAVRMTVQGSGLILSETGELSGTVTSLTLSYVAQPTQKVSFSDLSFAASIISDFTRPSTTGAARFNAVRAFDQVIADNFDHHVTSESTSEIDLVENGFHQYLDSITLGSGDTIVRFPQNDFSDHGPQLWQGGDGTDTIIFRTVLVVSYSAAVDGFNVTTTSNDDKGTFSEFEVIRSTRDLEFSGSPEADIVTTSGVATLDGKGGNDSLTGSYYADSLNGGTGRDYLIGGGGGDDLLIGGLGQDTIEDGWGDDIIYGDAGAIATDTDILVFRHLKAIYGDDVPGAWYDHWRKALADGASQPDDLREWAVTQLTSLNPALEDPVLFLSQVYKNALSIYRDLDFEAPYGFGYGPNTSGGVDFEGHLGDGDKVEILERFVSYSIFEQETAVNAFTFHASHLNGASLLDDVFRLYQAGLDRTPDEQGFFAWVEILLDGDTPQGIASGFTNSREFSNKYGELDFEGFLTLVYANVLDRAPDAAGLAGWTASLEGGASRADILHGFAQSREFQIATNSAFQDFLTGVNQGDVLMPGDGDNLVTGGLGADTFLFQRDNLSIRASAANNTTTITDFEANDLLQFDGFGVADAAEVLALSVLEGDDIRITLPSVEIFLHGAAAVLSEDHILIG